MEKKKLYRITEGKMICGVCSGLAKYFDADVTLVRLIAAASALFSGGTTVLAYIAAAVIMPEKKEWL
jgi:phage shock protein PspC (stress-responsive transcriptional regulator)